jgi:hypothetical protein
VFSRQLLVHDRIIPRHPISRSRWSWWRWSHRACQNVLLVKTHRRAARGNTRSREAPGTAGGPRSLGQRPEIRHMSWRLGCYAFHLTLYLIRKVLYVSFLHAQTHINISPSRDRLIRWLPISAVKSLLYSVPDRIYK